MKHIAKLMKNKQTSIAQQLLQHVDLLGAALDQVGIKNTVNRHTLVGQAWVQKHRLDGELDRLEMHLHNSLQPVKRLRSKVDSTVDGAIDYLPPALAKRAHRTHAQIKRLSGGC